ncbi:aminoglycoside phosphotransferase [Sphingobium chlorophenolicum L-1]|uniref:Aminoglycoside phosphotransferase n=1 Tax=Sphingobium chlorophenolicum L-1 TaxID=690566 RepID=F6F369_SPHCR|nr:phosphotransferase family protein [Sphingobium chlorophenolicum]AEG50881.1 aminoglycoside phosphotransferase [Sphingobium chlorophenolicum L-1]
MLTQASKGGITADTVEAYFSDRLGEAVQIESIKRVFPGVSRETWLVQTRLKGGSVGFVLRLDPPWGPCAPTSLEYEYKVYERLWRSPVPVAEPLWFAQNVEFAGGRPHMVRRMVEGSSTIAGLTDKSAGAAELRRRVVFDHMEKLALLHSLDWQAFGFDEFMPVPPSPKEALRFEYDHWRARWAERQTTPRPIVTEFLCWLQEQIPQDTPAISIMKGNNGVGEEIFHNGRVVALSDFELSALGDGALDLAFSQGTLSLIDPREAIAHYEWHVGHAVSPERFAFAVAWNTFKGLVMLDGNLLEGWIDGRDPRTTAGGLGLLMVRRLEKALAGFIGKDLVEAAAAVSEAGAGEYMDKE